MNRSQLGSVREHVLVYGAPGVRVCQLEGRYTALARLPALYQRLTAPDVLLPIGLEISRREIWKIIRLSEKETGPPRCARAARLADRPSYRCRCLASHPTRRHHTLLSQSQLIGKLWGLGLAGREAGRPSSARLDLAHLPACPETFIRWSVHRPVSRAPPAGPPTMRAAAAVLLCAALFAAGARAHCDAEDEAKKGWK